MPSLIRFFVIIAILVAIAYGAMYTIVSMVEPKPREMTQTINPNRLNK